MQVKIDTKEKFYVITVKESKLSADMTDDLYNLLLPYLQNDGSQKNTGIRNIVLNLKDLQLLDIATAEIIVKVQQKFYEAGASFIICEIQPHVEKFLDENNLLEMMNTTPTESEAGDILQMEEMERELLDGDQL
jgi:anti-anti-sigma factor